MYTPPVDPADEPAHVTRHLSDAIAATWQAIDRGRVEADAFFKDERRTFDPHMWAHIVRYEAVLSLTKEPGPRDWQLRPIHHSGIEIIQDGFRVRVCKAFASGPQSPGHNRARREYFQQIRMYMGLNDAGSNLLLYWRVAGDDLDLGLCKPKGVWKFKGQPKLEWQQPVQYDPFSGIKFSPAAYYDEVDVRHIDEADLDEFGAGG